MTRAGPRGRAAARASSARSSTGPGTAMTRWAELVAQAGYCHHPIRLRRPGRARRPRRPVRSAPSTTRSGSRTACCSRRAAPGGSPGVPSCAATYRADAYQLLAAGLKGGKGVPETVDRHPRLFVTFTAPSFGRVHTRKAQGRLVLPCHPYRQGARCPHGRRDGCWHRHDEDDPRLGEPLCPACYDAEAQVLWNALAARAVAADHHRHPACPGPAGRPPGGRAAPAGPDLLSPRWPSSSGAGRSTSTPSSAWTRPPTAAALAAWPHHPSRSRAALLEDALRQAVPAVRVPCPAVDEAGPDRYARWGEQLDVRNITAAATQAGELSAEQVAGYIAKYATKATESFGAASTAAYDADDLDRLDKLPAHVAELVRACWELGGRPELDGLRLRAWAHMLGFGGHWSTKSRRYSTTFTVLRRARVAFAKRRRARRRRAPGRLGPARGRPGRDRRRLLGLRRLRLRDRGRAVAGRCRPPLGLANSDGSPGRSYAPRPIAAA